MPNNYYTPSSNPANRSLLNSSLIRTEWASIEAGFNKLPALTGNAYKMLVINSTGTGMTVVGSGVYGNAGTTTNAAFGLNALGSDVGGIFSSAYGYNALGISTQGDYNTAVGASALGQNTTADRTTGVGALALPFASTGADNTGVGYNVGATLATGIQNTLIGSGANVTLAAQANVTAIGYGAVATLDNQVRLGNASVVDISIPVGAKLTKDGAAGTGATILDVTASGAGAVARTVANKLDESKTPEDFGPNTTPGTTDMTAEIVAALAASSVVYLKGTDYLISSRIDLTNKWLIMSERTRILMDVAAFTGAINGATGCAFLFSGATGGGICGGAVQLNCSYAALATSTIVANAVHVVSSSNVSLRGVDFSNFAKADGIVCVDTSNYTLVTNGCRFRDCNTNTAANGQITGINVDDARVGGVGSVGTTITNNLFSNLTVGATFLAANGYQTDGINIQTTGTACTITGNTFDTMGEAIDVYGDGGVIGPNSIKNSYYYGIKLIHGAQKWQVTGNQIIDSGIAGITLGGSSVVSQYVEKNNIVGNTIIGIDPLNINAVSACIQVSDQGAATYKCRNNNFSNNNLDPGTYGRYCIDRAGSTGGNNQFPNNNFLAVGVTGWVNNGSETGRVTASNKTAVRASVGITQSVASAGNVTINFDTEQYDDRAEWNAGTYRFTCQIPGLYRIRVQIRVNTITTPGSDLKVRLRLNATTIIAESIGYAHAGTCYVVEDVVNLASADYIEAKFVNGDTASVDITADPTISFITIEPA